MRIFFRQRLRFLLSKAQHEVAGRFTGMRCFVRLRRCTLKGEAEFFQQRDRNLAPLSGELSAPDSAD